MELHGDVTSRMVEWSFSGLIATSDAGNYKRKHTHVNSIYVKIAGNI